MLLKIAAEVQEESGPYRPRPSLAGPERCIRSLVYHAAGTPRAALPGRAVVIFDDGRWHQQLLADWIRKSAYQLHSEEMLVETPVGPGHIDGIITDLLQLDRLLEVKSVNHFSYERWWKGDYPLDYFTQVALYVAGLQKVQPEINEALLLCKNKNTSALMEFRLRYDRDDDSLALVEIIRSDGENSKSDFIMYCVTRVAVEKFRQVEEYAASKTLPARPFEYGSDWPCGYCVAPDTPILMQDHSWRPAESISVGDTLLAITEDPVGRDRRVCASRVEAVRIRIAPAVRLETTAGTIICSADHRWLAKFKNKNEPMRWCEAEKLSPGGRICRIADQEAVIAQDDNYKVGYIQGIVDGDGTIRKTGPWQRVRVAMADAEALTRLQEYLIHFGFPAKRGPFSSQRIRPMEKIWVSGLAGVNDLLEMLDAEITSPTQAAGYLAGIFDAEGTLATGKWSNTLRISNTSRRILDRSILAADILKIPLRVEPHARPGKNKPLFSIRPYTKRFTFDVIRFLGFTRPAITRKRDAICGARLYNSWATIIRIDPLGNLPLVDLQTSSRTFVASGLAAHNCTWAGTCWSGYEEEFESLGEDPALDEEMEHLAAYYLEASGHASEMEKEKKELREKIRAAMEAKQLKAGKAGPYIITRTMREREGWDDEFIPPAIAAKARTISYYEVLNIRKPKEKTK